MKYKSILILSVLLLAITASAATIVSKEITWREYPILSDIGLGDYVETTTYSDGYQEGEYHRGTIGMASIFFAPYKITIPSGQTSVNWEYTLEGQSCGLSGTYSYHKVDWYFDGVFYASENLGIIVCGKTVTYKTKDWRENDVGTHTILLKETMWNDNGMVVIEKRSITIVIEPNNNLVPAPTPTPTPTPQTGTISITSNPSGATVRVNSVEKGYTPIAFSMPPGNYIVSTSLAGYKTDNYGLTVTSGQESSHFVTLSPIVVTTPVPTSDQPSIITPTPTSPISDQTPSITPTPTSTVGQTPAVTQEIQCPSGFVWSDKYETCRPIADSFSDQINPKGDNTVYIILGAGLLAGIYLLRRKDIKW